MLGRSSGRNGSRRESTVARERPGGIVTTPGRHGLAMVLVVRDEAEKIATHLTYHHALGVDRAWVFVDRSGDATAELADAFPWVTVIRRDRTPEERFLSTFQTGCMARGLELARAEGWRWLLHLDPDEFACGHSPASLRRWLRPLDRHPERHGGLGRLLERVAPGTEMVVLAPNDVLPTPRAPGAPFHHLVFTLRRGAVARPMLDPVSGEVRRLDRPLGHDKGKALVRTEAPVEPASAHRWRPTDGRRELRTEHRGFHFHYVVTDGEGWWRKYRRLAEYPAHWDSGHPVSFPKQTFKEAARTMGRDEAVAWFDRWLLWRRRDLLPALATGKVVYDPFVRQVVEGAGS